MSKASDVLGMLIPTGGWLINGDDYEGIKFLECEPITKKQFTEGFAKFDEWQAAKTASDLAKKEVAQAKLAALGITVDDLMALGL